jgi:hypothetical protein
MLFDFFPQQESVTTTEDMMDIDKILVLAIERANRLLLITAQVF